MKSSILSLLSLLILFVSLSLSLEIKGIPSDKIELYNKDVLTCDGGKKVLKKEWINDGYCDCEDGFDEPSTSACMNSHFYCKNEGYASYLIPSQWVNDRVCDCCDGSDEVEGLCKNTCRLQIKEKYEKLKKEAEKYKDALDKKAKWINKAKEAESNYETKGSLENELNEIEQNIKDMSEKVSTLKRTYDEKLNELIQAEREKQVNEGQDDNKDEKKRNRELKRKAENHQEAKDLYNELRLAEDELNQLKDKKSKIQKDISKIDVINSIDFGKDKAYFGMHGKTYSIKAGSFDYKLFPFDRVKQGSVTIGRWDRWEDGKMMYNLGERCPNGIVRSCEVSVVCGKKAKILSVEEPSPCKYLMTIKTPAACDEDEYNSLIMKIEELEKELKD